MADEAQPKVSDATRQVEQRDAQAAHSAPEVPTPEEEAAAPAEADPRAAEAYEEYLDKAADQSGEGRIPLKLQDTTFARGARTLLEVEDELASLGFGGQASAEDGPSVRCFACDRSSPAADVEVHALHRLEGASDPDDMAVVVAVTCPQCSVGSSLVLSYGPAASAVDADVLRALPDPPEVVDAT